MAMSLDAALRLNLFFSSVRADLMRAELRYVTNLSILCHDNHKLISLLTIITRITHHSLFITIAIHHRSLHLASMGDYHGQRLYLASMANVYRYYLASIATGDPEDDLESLLADSTSKPESSDSEL